MYKRQDKKNAITCRPADLLEPELDKIEAEMKQWKQQDEDVLTYALFPQVATDFFKYREAQQTKVDQNIADKMCIRDRIRAEHIQLEHLKEEEFDEPLGCGSGAAVIFGATGGVMEAALRKMCIRDRSYTGIAGLICSYWSDRIL